MAIYVDWTGPRAVIREMTDFFFDKPITYYRDKGISTDFWAEDNVQSRETYQLKCLTDFQELKTDWVDYDISGLEDVADVKIMFNVDYLEDEGLWDAATNSVRFSVITDSFLLMGAVYKVIYSGYEGQMSDKHTLVVLLGSKLKKKG